ncbi:HDOD domain-containing protein [Thiorhodovibrio frisius]|uniref:Putative signal transduction protein n=1 Tax=Thiorhodovibrio frisius TaxID=631362 RepID=H8Z4B4_9GAMM|nr:HDOD domain-containing protein [Thiorhodovibrio frisius]EIC20171.1 putative signal transduction protein [Thiorhodovibrio frisius]WPL20908.1 HDOD domain protein [Thiorhodovibrio frisius]
MSEGITPSAVLAQMEITKGLSEQARAELAGQARLLRLDKGKRLARRQADNQLSGQRLFLVDGNVVRACNGLEREIDSCFGLSDPVELFDETGCEDDAIVTQARCLLLGVPAALLSEMGGDGAQLNELDLDDAEGDFLTELYEQINSNRLELPARPEVALRIQKLTADPDAGIAELTELIQSDATLAGALIHATNSPRFRAAKEITSVRDAVVRIGFSNTRMLATNLALRQIFRAKHQVARDAIAEVWAEGVLRSAYCSLLAQKLNLLDQDRALLAGLLARVGAVPIIQFFDQRGSAGGGRQELDELLEKLLSVTGVLVINYWELGSDLVAVAEQSTNWSYQAPEPDYASLSIVARWAALAHHGQPRPPAAEIPAFACLGMQPPGEDGTLAELEGSEAALDRLQSMFET